MKKVLAIMLSLALLFGALPTAVFAGGNNPSGGNNGPADVDWAFIRFIFNGEGEGVDVGSVYENKTAYNNDVNGAAYDTATNTLTIDNYCHPENGLSVNMMGDDFRLNVVGECELAYIVVWGDGWGGSITVTGNGTLTVNENKIAPCAIMLNAEYVEASLTVDADVTLHLYGDEGVFSSSMNLLESPEDVVKTVGGRESFDLNGAPFYYQNSQYLTVYQITDAEAEAYKGCATVKSDDPDTYYSTSISTYQDGRKEYRVARYVYSESLGVYLEDPVFVEEYKNDWGEVIFSEEEFSEMGFSMTVSGYYFKTSWDSDFNTFMMLKKADDPNSLYGLFYDGYLQDSEDIQQSEVKGTIYKLEYDADNYDYIKLSDFEPIVLGEADYETLPAGFSFIVEEDYETLYLKGEINEYSGNLYVDAQDNQYIIYNIWSDNQDHQYVYAINEVSDIPGCYVATYVEDIAGVDNHGYTEVTTPVETGTFEYTTDITEFSFNGGGNSWEEEHIIRFDEAEVIDSHTVVFGEGNDAVTLTAVNAEINENGEIHTYDSDELYSIFFEISGAFDADEMKIYALALDGYTGELFITENNEAMFVNPENENDRLHFPTEIYISLDSFIPYLVAEDSNGNVYMDGDTLTLEPGESVFVGFFTSGDNWLHGIFPSYGFNYGVAGEGNFADSLTSMGFEVTEGVGEDFNLGTDRYNGVYGCLITAPDTLQAGTRARMPFSLYELPENFSWDDMWANFSWSDTPKVLENNMYIEVASGDNTTGDCTWSYDAGSKTLTVSGNGAMADYGYISGANSPVPSPWSNYDIEKVVIEYGVTHIGNDAFMGENIYDVDIADSVTSIGTNAFHSCGALDFVMLPPNLTEAGAYAFYNTQLREIEIPSTVTSIGQCAFGFYYDGDLDRDMPIDGFEIYGYSGTAAETYADTYGFTFHDNTVYLSQDGLWKYSIRPDGGAKLYSDIPWGYSYQGHDSVVTIPSTIDGYTVKEIGVAAMSNLDFVTKIIVPDSVESIGFSAFSDCTHLQELVLGNNIQEIGAQAIDHTAIPFEDGAVYCNGYLLRVDPNYEGMFTVKPGTKLMGMFSFGNCSNVDRVILPDSITKIDYATFVGCTSLKEILIPHSVGFIYDGAFTDYNEQTGQEERSLEVIYGSPNTGAHAFAEQNEIPFVNIEEIDRGDTNGDGEITLADYQAVKSSIIDEELDIYGIIAGDVNRDNALDAFDLFLIDKRINNIGLTTYSYTVTGGNNAKLTGYSGTETAVKTPQRIDGFSVTAIDNYTFRNNTNINKVTVSGGVKTIGYGAFLNCTSLTEVSLPETATSIGTYAFKGCTNLEKIVIPASVTSINANSFTGCDKLTIYGKAGSYAETYANANSISFTAI
ncbi:MAG: leucine-rich repeat protein [Clostridia bacterium]|nr:leucine-rich repeat protein [Clostridia bacterium]